IPTAHLVGAIGLPMRSVGFRNRLLPVWSAVTIQLRRILCERWTVALPMYRHPNILEFTLRSPELFQDLPTRLPDVESSAATFQRPARNGNSREQFPYRAIRTSSFSSF